MIHHGSLYTTKSAGDRHSEHARNCVKDSRAWRERQRQVTISEVVEEMIERFGECPSSEDRWYAPRLSELAELFAWGIGGEMAVKWLRSAV